MMHGTYVTLTHCNMMHGTHNVTLTHYNMMHGTHVTLTHCNMMHGTHSVKLMEGLKLLLTAVCSVWAYKSCNTILNVHSDI